MTSKTKDGLGDRMKEYEFFEAGRRLLPLLPVMVRLDGRSFHTFTRGMKRPYDERMCRMMIDTTKYLVEETGALIGYTQSDEISLVLYTDNSKSEIFFDGRIQKLTSVLASLASVKFFQLTLQKFPEKARLMPAFDCRVWNVPNLTEAANTLLWREIDASKNSISMAAHSYFSHNQVMNKKGHEKQEMLFQKYGINWNDYPAFFKRGTYIQKRKISKRFSFNEISKLPLKHAARKDPDLVFERTEIRELEMGKMLSILNRTEVLFEGKDPVYDGSVD